MTHLVAKFSVPLHVDGYSSLDEKDSLELTDGDEFKFSLKGDYAHFIIIEMEKTE